MQILSNLNVHLARAVIVAAAMLALAVSGLAIMTGQPTLLIGAAFGIGSGAYGFAVARRAPEAETVRVVRVKQPMTA